MSNKNKETVEKVNAALAKDGTEGFLSFCAEDLKWTMVGDKTITGKEAIRKWMTSMGSEPPKFTVDNVIADGDFVAVRGDLTMKDKDGKAAQYSYCDIYHLRNDKIVELSSYVIKTEGKYETSAGRK